MNFLKNEHFDVGMTEIYSTCAFALFYKIGLETFITGYCTNMVEFSTIPFGIDNNPSFVPGNRFILFPIIALPRIFLSGYFKKKDRKGQTKRRLVFQLAETYFRYAKRVKR